MFKSNDAFFYVMAIAIGALIAFFLSDWSHQGTLTLRPSACSFAKSAGAAPAAIDAGCTLDGKYDIGRSFTELRLPNELRLLISNAEISGIVKK
ncbi:MAG TPA: hypothetical protein VFW53_03440 [Gallionella sp.]|nr:hypothetical protein [Gallionella sp.]